MASTEHIKEFHVDREQLAGLNELMYDTVQLIADPATEEHVLFDVVGAYGSDARTMLPEIANAMEDLAVHGETRAVVVHLPEETSECYGPTPPDYPVGRNLHPSDVYRALLAGMPTGHGAKGLFAYRTKYFSGLQNNVIATKTTHSSISSSASGALVLHTEGVYQNYSKDIEPAAGELPRNSSPDFFVAAFCAK